MFARGNIVGWTEKVAVDRRSGETESLQWMTSELITFRLKLPDLNLCTYKSWEIGM